MRRLSRARPAGVRQQAFRFSLTGLGLRRCPACPGVFRKVFRTGGRPSDLGFSESAAAATGPRVGPGTPPPPHSAPQALKATASENLENEVHRAGSPRRQAPQPAGRGHAPTPRRHGSHQPSLRRRCDRQAPAADRRGTPEAGPHSPKGNQTGRPAAVLLASRDAQKPPIRERSNGAHRPAAPLPLPVCRDSSRSSAINARSQCGKAQSPPRPHPPAMIESGPKGLAASMLR